MTLFIIKVKCEGEKDSHNFVVQAKTMDTAIEQLKASPYVNINTVVESYEIQQKTWLALMALMPEELFSYHYCYFTCNGDPKFPVLTVHCANDPVYNVLQEILNLNKYLSEEALFQTTGGREKFILDEYDSLPADMALLTVQKKSIQTTILQLFLEFSKQRLKSLSPAEKELLIEGTAGFDAKVAAAKTIQEIFQCEAVLNERQQICRVSRKLSPRGVFALFGVPDESKPDGRVAPDFRGPILNIHDELKSRRLTPAFLSPEFKFLRKEENGRLLSLPEKTARRPSSQRG